jgi:ABC-2 type transport system permease protein
MMARIGLRGRPLNPVLARELKERMRGRRATLVLTVYLLVLAGVLQLIYSGASRLSAGVDGPGAVVSASVGRTMFHTLLFFMLMLVCFIVPGLTAGSVAGERERQTLVPLQVTPLRPRSILVGKLLASLAYISLLVVATLPLIGVSFLLGGVTLSEVVRGVAMVLVVAVTLACLALLCSTYLRRVQGATVVSYAVVLFLAVGTFFLYGAQLLATRQGAERASEAVLVVNPFVATADVVRGREGAAELVPSPFSPLQSLTRRAVATTEARVLAPEGAGGVVVEADGVLSDAPERPARAWWGLPFWSWSVGAYAALGLAALWLASRRLRVPSPEGAR